MGGVASLTLLWGHPMGDAPAATALLKQTPKLAKLCCRLVRIKIKLRLPETCWPQKHIAHAGLCAGPLCPWASGQSGRSNLLQPSHLAWLSEIHPMSSRACYYIRRALIYIEFILFLPSLGFLIWGKFSGKYNKTQRDTVTFTRLF